jgi:hypothetical protein
MVSLMMIPKLTVSVFELTIFKGMELCPPVPFNSHVKSVDKYLALVSWQSNFLEQAMELSKSIPLL